MGENIRFIVPSEAVQGILLKIVINDHVDDVRFARPFSDVVCEHCGHNECENSAAWFLLS